MNISEYKAIRVPFNEAQEFMAHQIAAGWQPMGPPIVVQPLTDQVVQVLVKGAGGSVTGYKVERMPLHMAEDLTAHWLADGWQPLGHPAMAYPDTGIILQAMVKGDPPGSSSNSGGTGIAAADIADATATGIALMTAGSAATARTAIGAGTGSSNLAVATTAPAALAAAAAVGTGTTAARADHVHAFPAQLATGRTISLTGGATGTSAAFNGSANASIAVTLATPTATVRGGVLQGAAVADADEASAVTQLNALLAALRTAGVIAA